MYIYRETTYEKMSRRAANILSAQVIQKPDSVLGLATGSTPVGVYRQLIEWYRKGDLDFKDVTTVNLDEYCGLPAEHEQSYRYFMNSNLFDHINIDKYRTYVPNGMCSDCDTECENYDKLISALGGIDLQLLGIGFNGHIVLTNRLTILIFTLAAWLLPNPQCRQIRAFSPTAVCPRTR